MKSNKILFFFREFCVFTTTIGPLCESDIGGLGSDLTVKMKECEVFRVSCRLKAYTFLQLGGKALSVLV